MEYTQEVLDRGSGQLTTQSRGDWITVTELGQRYSAGPKTVRAILHHMGLLGIEKRRHRLTRQAVSLGLGIRHDRPKSGYPFDVISPEGQRAVASAWEDTLADFRADRDKDPQAAKVQAALGQFKARRSGPMTAEEETCWILDHFKDTEHSSIAKLLGVSPALVTRHAQRRSVSRDRLQRQKKDELSKPAMRTFGRMRMTDAGPMPCHDE